MRMTTLLLAGRCHPRSARVLGPGWALQEEMPAEPGGGWAGSCKPPTHELFLLLSPHDGFVRMRSSNSGCVASVGNKQRGYICQAAVLQNSYDWTNGKVDSKDLEAGGRCRVSHHMTCSLRGMQQHSRIKCVCLLGETMWTR